MAKNFAEIAFTEAVKEMQEKEGSRKAYERMEKSNVVNGLSENEIAFIADRDSFYLSSISANNYPYIQHRGGPKGFVKVLDENTIGFLDFTGNKQYISVGNFATNNNVALFMMDYSHRARLKFFAKVEIVDINDKPDFEALFDLGDYNYKPERIMIFHIQAYDWNCPQHITPRYTAQEIEQALAPQRDYIRKLEAEIKALKQDG
jgi:uncharacterized protein